MKMKSLFTAFAAVLFLTACSSDPAWHAPQMTYDNLAPVALNVAQVEVRDDYKPPMQAPNVEHTFQTPLYAAAENLLKKQLVAAGSANILRAIIQDASAVEEDLPIDKSFWGHFKKEQSKILKARVVVRFEMASAQAPDLVLSNMTMTAKRNLTLPEGASPSDREKAFFKLTEELTRDLSAGVNSTVKNVYGKM